MYKIAVVGDYDSIYGFATLGLDICPVSGQEEIRKTLARLAGERYGIIYITEAAADAAADELERYQEMTLPAVIRIPGVSGNTGSGVEGVRKTVEQAVGSDILFGGVDK
ncbi:MAG TPA: V-type ATP synthase subunit F [Candidatus Mediterraneibacter merdipullorum]|nr:V-type ATP synthase subunit F [Candidatus Mediterraneibacter merdipullorum]